MAMDNVQPKSKHNNNNKVLIGPLIEQMLCNEFGGNYMANFDICDWPFIDQIDFLYITRCFISLFAFFLNMVLIR